MTTYTRDHMEAACCLWEAMLELRTAKDFSTLPDGGDVVVAAFKAHGAVAMRDVAIDLAVVANAAWESAPADERTEPFDWEFCPKFILSLDWSQWPPTLAHPSQDQGAP